MVCRIPGHHNYPINYKHVSFNSLYLYVFMFLLSFGTTSWGIKIYIPYTDRYMHCSTEQQCLRR